MMVATRPKLLFSPCYAEPLKAMVPLIEAANPSYDVFVLNTISPSVNDKAKSEPILLATQIPFASEYERAGTGDLLEKRPRWMWLLLGVDDRARKLTKGIITQALVQYAHEARWRRISQYWLDTVQPSALIVGVETTPIQKHLIEECNRRAIKTVMLQWGIANASVRHTREMAERFAKRDALTLNRRARWRKKLIGLLTRVVLRLTGLYIKIPSRVFGGGHAKVFAIIGQGSYENYVELGINPDKMVVVGYPIYEGLYRNAEELTNDQDASQALYDSLGLSPGREMILWCTNDQRTYYEALCSYEELLESWKSKIRILLALGEGYEIVVKLHPKELLRDYEPLGKLSDRVHVVEDYDVRKMIPHCCLFITRFSSTAVDAMCLGKPVITHNYPLIPGGTLYEDIGGTIHVKSDEEFRDAVTGILVDGRLLRLTEDQRNQFVSHYLDFSDEPAATRFIHLIDTLVSSRATAGSQAGVA